MKSDAVVELNGVWFAYGAEPVLQDISLAVGRGDFLGLVGPNGSGKTTLLRIILGLQRPHRGSVRLFGQDRARFREWSRVGYVPQRATSFNSGFPATAREVVLTGRVARRGLFRRLRPEDYLWVRRALQLVDMDAHADRPIGQLSGGQQQRVFVARALAGQPELLILDEPTTGVDAAAREQFYGLLQRLRRSANLTIVLVSHDLAATTAQVSHVASLDRVLTLRGPCGCPGTGAPPAGHHQVLLAGAAAPGAQERKQAHAGNTPVWLHEPGPAGRGGGGPHLPGHRAVPGAPAPVLHR